MMRGTRRTKLGGVGASLAICAAVTLTACGTAAKTVPSSVMTMPDGTVMSQAQMNSMPGMMSSTTPQGTDSQSGGPTAVAKMICTADTAGAVHRNLTVAAIPTRHATWADQTYTCDYALPGGSLTLSVKDLTSRTTGRTWFNGLRKQLPGSSTIQGMANLGFPAFETTRGDVVFLKDGKTLWVDATRVPSKFLPQGSTRTGVAYGVAAAVIACWKG